MYKLCIISILLPFHLFANELAFEPHVLNPKSDQNLIRSFNLDNSPDDWNDPIINILFVGQDGRTPLPYPLIKRETGEEVLRLSSRADATVVLSFNKITGKTTLFSIERHNPDPSDNNEILTHQYILKGRGTYLKLVKNRVSKMVQQMKAEKQFFAKDDRLHVHGIVEVDFVAFNRIVQNLRENLFSSAQVAWSFRGHTIQLAEALNGEFSILKRLRARQNFPAGSYQRSLNHAFFIRSMLGVLSYTLVESQEKRLLENPLLHGIFNELSRTFNLNNLFTSLKMVGSANSVLEKSGFRSGISTSDVYLLGIDSESYASHIGGQLKVSIPERAARTSDSLLNRLNTDAAKILVPVDCASCL